MNKEEVWKGVENRERMKKLRMDMLKKEIIRNRNHGFSSMYSGDLTSRADGIERPTVTPEKY